MSLKILTHHTRMVLSVTDPESIEDLKREIDDFVGRIRPGDTFSIEVAMASSQKRVSERSPVGSCGSVAEAILAFEAALGSRKLRPFLKDKGISRSTWYNWRSGLSIGRSSLEKLIEIAPSEEVRNLLIAARK